MLKFLFLSLFLAFAFLSKAQNVKPISMQSIVSSSGESTKQMWYAPLENVGEVGKFHKMEIGFQLDKKITLEVENFITKKENGINPFNPEEINIEVKLTSPTNEEIKTHGFYYVPYMKGKVNDIWVADTTTYPWRLRFAPNEIGNWKVNVAILIGGKQVDKVNFYFNCVESGHKGILKTSHTGELKDRYLYESETGNTFIPIGHNITTRGKNVDYFKNELHKKWINELADNGGNFFRMELPPGGALPTWPTWPYDSLSYKACFDYSHKLDKMYGFDEVFDLAEARKMYFILMRHHVEVGSNAEWGVPWDSWTNNPYKAAFKLNSSEKYFTDSLVIKQQRKALQYIFARWGYSPYFTFYSYQEIDNWTSQIGLDKNQSFDVMANWIVDQKKYIRNNLHFLSDLFLFPFTSGYPADELKQGARSTAHRMIEESDIIGLHAYHNVKRQNYTTRYNYVEALLKSWKNTKPVLLEEVGLQMQEIYCCSDADFHNTVWSSVMMGGMGTGLHWSWDRGIHDNGYYVHYNNLKSFLEGEDLREGNFKQQRWKDKGNSKLNKTKIENFSLVSKDKKRVLGWVHNATFYWRNLKEINPCLAELIDSGKISNPCELEDKSPLLGGEINPNANYENIKFVDKYTDQNGAIKSIEYETFNVKGLKKNGNRVIIPWGKKHWYKVSFYSTYGEVNSKPVEFREYSTSVTGKLKIYIPKLTIENPDFSYKIEYVGFEKRKKAKF